MTLPGMDVARRLLDRHARKGAHVLEIDDGRAPLARDLAAAGYSVTSTRPGAALGAPESVDVVLCLQPTRFGALIPLMEQVRRALVPGGIAIVTDLVWQTAPTPELLRAFAPEKPGGERVRPIEGYEMQVEHAGFEVVERDEAPRAALLAALDEASGRRAAVAADDRGAAKLAAWALRKSG